MKKFLPFIIFVVVFAAVLAGQVGYKVLYKGHDEMSLRSEYKDYEDLFLHANYKNIQGQSIDMIKLNSPVVIYNFWASWCIPCLAEMPSMLALKNKFKPNQIKIVAINTDEENQLGNIMKTIKKINMKDEFIIVPDKESKIVNDFKVSAIPLTIVFNKGKVVHFSNGPMDFNSEEFIEKMKGWVKF